MACNNVISFSENYNRNHFHSRNLYIWFKKKRVDFHRTKFQCLSGVKLQHSNGTGAGLGENNGKK